MSNWLFYGYVALLTIIMLVSFIHKNKIQKDYLDPFTLFSGSFYIYSVIGAFDNKGSFESNYIAFIFYASCIIGYSFFVFGYFHKLKCSFDIVSGNGKIRTTLLPGIMQGTCIQKIDAIMILCLFVCLIANADVFKSMITNFGQGVSYTATAVRSSGSIFNGAISLIKSYFQLFMIGYPAYRMFKSNRISLFDVFLYLIYGVYAFASGYRVILIYLIITILCFFNYRHKRIRLGVLAVISCVGLLGLIALGHLRAESNIFDMLNMFTTGGIRYLRLTSSGEFVNTVGTFATYVKAISSGAFHFNFGYSWLVEILIFIPTFIWSNRPLPWPQQYMKDFFPNALAGTGHGWFILDDGYMAFGVLGIAFEMFIVGMALAKAYEYFMKGRRNPLKMVMYTTLLYYTIIMTRSSFLGSLKNYLLFIIPLILINIITSPMDDEQCYLGISESEQE